MHDRRSSNVTVENASARTAVRTLGQRFRGDRVALRAFSAGSSWVDFDQFATGAFSLIANERNELAPRGIIDRLRKNAAGEALNVQSLDRDATKAVNDLSGVLVQEVAAGIGNVRMMPSNCGLALAVNIRSPFASGERALQSTKLCGVALREVWTLDYFTVALSNERRQPHVQSDHIRAGALGRRDVDVKNDEPFVRVAGENAGLGLARHLPMPTDFDFAGDAYEGQLSRCPDRHAIADAKVRGVIAVASPKTRKSRRLPALHPGEKRFVGLIQFPQHLLLSCGRPSTLVRKVASDLRQRHNLFVALDRNAALVGADPMLQGPVVQRTEIAEHLRQRNLLRFVRLNAVAIRKDHGALYLGFHNINNKRKGGAYTVN